MPATNAQAMPQRAALVAVDGRTYPLKSARIDARAEGGLAFTTLVQSYLNPYAEPLEVLYTLPLPADGAVVGYCFRLGEKLIRGEVERRDDAEAIYRSALEQGRAASLLEQDRDDTFQMRLGSLPPGQSADIEIQVLQPLGFLPADEGQPPRWEYRFPTVVGVRYQGAPGRVPDAERMDVNRAAHEDIPARVELNLAIDDGAPDTLGIVSPSHSVVAEAAAFGASVRFSKGARLDRDLIVHWNASTESIGVRLVEGLGLPGDSGRYAALTLTPPRSSKSVLSRDVTILLDASGSMSGEPIQSAKKVVADLLRSLEPSDRFEVLAFSGQVKRLTSSVLEAKPREIERALGALAKLEAGGGTEMATALVEALSPLREGSQRQVVLVTDGYIGFEQEVTGEILRRLPSGTRIHVVGIGSAPNRSLTRSVARAGRGLELLIGGDEVAAASRRLRQAMEHPVLTDLAVTGTALKGVAPARGRDVLVGQPIVFLAEIAAEGGTIEAEGSLAGSPERWVWRIHVPPAANVGNGHGEADSGAAGPPSSAFSRTMMPIGALYAREAVADLELELAAGTAPKASIDEAVEALGLRHRIATRRTSLVAIAEMPSVDPREPRRRERLPLEMPAGVSPEGAGLMLASGAFPAAELKSLCLLEQNLLSAPRSWKIGRAQVSKAPAIVTAHVLRAEGQEIALEFEVPEDGFEMPAGEVGVTTMSRPAMKARVVAEKSSPLGPHRRGLIVRIVLQLESAGGWPEGEIVFIGWPLQSSALILQASIPKSATTPPWGAGSVSA
ncbi:MAG TPA: VIT domain-containing protein [Candidatus Limnocylindria bacterium]|nr:VIT domain-containing protein [Candidatus Limnocylindria bacterium]